MKKLGLVAVCVAIVASMSGCVGVFGGNGVAVGAAYSGYKMSGVVGTGTGTKTGKACAMSILELVALGDASISAAKKEGGITQVAHVDYDVMNILGVYGTVCTVVVGQ